MSFLFHHRSIRNKFSLVVTTSSFAVLLLVSLLFGCIEYVSFRQKAAAEMQTLSEVLGDHLIQPLMDQHKIKTKQVLSALSTNHHVRAAYLFGRENRPIAQYLDSESTAFVEASVQHDFSGRFPEYWQQAQEPVAHYGGLKYLSLYTPIFYQNKKIGGLYLLSDVSDLNQRLLGFSLVVLLAGGAAVGFAWGFSGWLQKPISGPILQLAETMHQISSTGNYRLRGEKYSDDEVGQLVDGFNDMLNQIEIRDQEIDAHQKYLEQTVNQRTAELTATVNDLEQARQQAEAANQAKSVFLANMTHELRTPLVGVLGMNELLVESRLDPQQKSLALSVQRSGQELLDLINEILDFSRMEGGHLRLKTEKVDLLKLVEETVAILADRAYSKGLELICRVEPEAAWEVEADSQRLKQILVNLLGNAIKFTQSGHVGIRLSTCSDRRFLFEISDTGIGIDRQGQSSIFDAFSQLDDSTARVFGGTGLGLSIVRELTCMMEGHLHLESELERGSVFRVELPLARIRRIFVTLPTSQSDRSVLLFEPYLQARESRLQMLRDLGFKVEAVTGPEELLQRLKSAERQEKCFDLTILPTCDQDPDSGTLAVQVATCCRTVICLSKKLSGQEKKNGVVDILQPLLWSRLLQADLFSAREVDSVNTGETEKRKSLAAEAVDCREKARILVVDDNVSTRELIGISLSGSSWLCDEACNAEEALAATQRQNYLLILMDVNMPGIDGLEATRILRERGLETPIFALTAHGDEHIFEECRQVGMQGFLRKPFRQRELFALLEEQSQIVEMPVKVRQEDVG